ncbi:hypothetical protein GCM10027395_23860 [Giesbergeria sinuosa]
MYCGTPSTPGTPNKYKSRAFVFFPRILFLSMVLCPQKAQTRRGGRAGGVGGDE